MIEINDKWLTKLGVVTASKKSMQSLVSMATAELEWRIGNIISQELTDEQLREFETIKDEDSRIAWLGEAFPAYKKVTKNEYDKMGQQIMESTDKAKLIRSWKNPLSSNA